MIMLMWYKGKIKIESYYYEISNNSKQKTMKAATSKLYLFYLMAKNGTTVQFCAV